jgi:hypothetical protein
MALFGKKQDPDQKRLAERTPEIQAEIDRWFAYLNSVPGTPRPVTTFKAILSMTTEERDESKRLSALRDPEE